MEDLDEVRDQIYDIIYQNCFIADIELQDVDNAADEIIELLKSMLS